MPATYTLISSNVLTSSAASVVLSAIPSTYTDLVLRMSVRGTYSGDTTTAKITVNSITSGYSQTRLQGNGASASSSRDSSDVQWYAYSFNANTSTSNTFATGEFYLPSYTASQNKPASFILAGEQNGTTAYIGAQAQLLSNTATISSITFATLFGDIASGSSFYLYGISNA